MAFKLGDVIVDRLQLGYGCSKSTGAPLYTLTQLNNANIDITADSTDVVDKNNVLVYRKYTGKKGDVTATNAFLNMAILEAVSGSDAEIASKDKGVIMPMFKIVEAGSTVDITGYVEGTVVVSALSLSGAMGDKAYTLGASTAGDTEFAIKHTEASGTSGEPNYVPATDVLTPPTDKDEVRYIVKYKATINSGAKVTISGNKYPKAHELFFKALVVDKCEPELFRAAIVHIPSFMPSPAVTVALQGGDSQTMDYTGSMMANACSADQELCSIYYIDEEEEDIL